MNIILLKDVLYNLATDSGASDDYARGVTLGIVAGMMSQNSQLTFNDAWEIVQRNLPTRCRENYCPPTWKEVSVTTT